jgi:hypothetical protein
LQRFINRDEPLLRDGPNPYPYVHNSPTNFTDPSGQEQYPADDRGTWIQGTKGNGVFRYHDTPQNRAAGLANKELVFRNNCIGIGGFPAEFYYGGNAKHASVEIEKVTGTGADDTASDAKMREKLKDPNWRRPEGYTWNHAGDSSSTTMELTDSKAHAAAAHQGSAAKVRAEARANKAKGFAGKGFGAAAVYLNIRDALKMAGVIKQYNVEYAPYYFVDDDGNVFIVQKPWLRSWRRKFVAGPRAGQTENITCEEANAHQAAADAKYGKLEGGGWFGEPRFIPGTERTRMELYDADGLPAGYIDEDGVHEYSDYERGLIA